MSLASPTSAPPSPTSKRRRFSSSILPRHRNHYLLSSSSSENCPCSSFYNYLPHLRRHVALNTGSSCKPLLPLSKKTSFPCSSPFFSYPGHHHLDKGSVSTAGKSAPGGAEGLDDSPSVIVTSDRFPSSPSSSCPLQGKDFCFVSCQQTPTMDQPSFPSSSSLPVSSIVPVGTFVGEVFRKECSVHPTPFYLYDEARIRYNCRRLLSAFSWVGKQKRCRGGKVGLAVTVEQDAPPSFAISPSSGSSSSSASASLPLAGTSSVSVASKTDEKSSLTAFAATSPTALSKSTTSWPGEPDQPQQRHFCKENGFILLNNDDSDQLSQDKSTYSTSDDDKTSTSFTNFFAVKATPTPAILEIIKEEGFGVDCSSLGELLLAEAVGFCGESIFFTSNDTPAEDFLKAYELGATINLDDENHLNFLRQTLGKRRLPSLLCFR